MGKFVGFIDRRVKWSHHIAAPLEALEVSPFPFAIEAAKVGGFNLH
jgi:hypothetical protein